MTTRGLNRSGQVTAADGRHPACLLVLSTLTALLSVGIFMIMFTGEVAEGSPQNCYSLCRRSDDPFACRSCNFREPFRFGKRSAPFLEKSPVEINGQAAPKRMNPMRAPLRFGKRTRLGGEVESEAPQILPDLFAVDALKLSEASQGGPMAAAATDLADIMSLVGRICRPPTTFSSRLNLNNNPQATLDGLRADAAALLDLLASLEAASETPHRKS